MLHRELKLFICSTSTPIETLKSESQPIPLVQFHEAHHQELDIHSILLTPLTPSDIAEHLNEVFSQVRFPEHFEEELARVTQGNPLFLSEILRKLALDQKIHLSGQQRRRTRTGSLILWKPDSIRVKGENSDEANSLPPVPPSTPPAWPRSLTSSGAS